VYVAEEKIAQAGFLSNFYYNPAGGWRQFSKRPDN
jgi:hypothetical protein